MIDERAVEICNDGLEELFLRTGHRFRRVEPRRRMRDCIRGLLVPVGRKNGRQPAEYAGHRIPDRLQRLLNGARWNADELRDGLQHYVAERLGEPDGILILDNTGFLKKGTTSAGVQRQYSGTAGRTENCRIGVFTAYVTPHGRALLDRELYLPRSWTDDRDRCRAAHIPDERAFATKPDPAKAMVLRAIASPLPIARVTADAAYGQEWRLRRMLEETGPGYVLAVPTSQQVPHFGRIDHLFCQAPDEARERRPCGDGAKSPHVCHWAAPQITSIEDFDGEMPTHSGGRRHAAASASPIRSPTTSITRRSAPRSRTWSALQGCAGPSRNASRPPRTSAAPTSTKSAAAPAGCDTSPRPCRRMPFWRSWPPMPRQKGGSGNGSCLAPLTVAEVRRLLATGHPPATPAHQSLIRTRALRRSQWRRQRQAVARRCHYQRRLHTIEGRSAKENTGRQPAHHTHPNHP